jgi:hypothetical protein
MKRDQKPSLDLARGVCVEVGTWNGSFARALLRRPSVRHVYCVDPYTTFAAEDYRDAMNALSQEDFDLKFNRVRRRLTSTFPGRVSFLRKPSTEASADFEDGSVDFVYIDGNHDYTHVRDDLRAWYPKVKAGGYLCGDDVCSRRVEDYDDAGNLVKTWRPGCWGTYGVYPALLDSGLHFRLRGSQFSIWRPLEETPDSTVGARLHPVAGVASIATSPISSSGPN